MAARANYISLCAGIGGLDLGLRRALPSARCVLYVEREVQAVAVLAARMAEGALDDAPVWSDLRTFDGAAWRGLVQGIIGGIPCQPFSHAGKRRGEADDRNLWPDVLRIVGEVAPAWCFFENVPGMANRSVDWYYYRAVRPRLQEMGYRVAEGFFTAAEVGAPHKRERLFILADGDGARWPPSGIAHDEHAGSGPGARSGELADGGHDAGGAEQRVQQEEQPAGAGQRGAPLGRGDGDVGNAEGGETDFQKDAGGQVGNSNSTRLQGRRVSGEGTDEIYPWPPSPRNIDAWARVLAVRPELAPATSQSGVRALADGAAGGALRPVKSQDESPYCTQVGPAGGESRTMRHLWNNNRPIGTSPSSGVRPPNRRDGAMQVLSRQGGTGNGAPKNSKARASSQVCCLSHHLSTNPTSVWHAMRLCGVSGNIRSFIGEPPVGRTQADQIMRLLWQGVPIQEAEGNDLWAILLAATRVADSETRQLARTDKLRLLGNTCVPTHVAHAFRALAAHV